MGAALQIGRNKPSTMAALGKFGGFRPEVEQAVRKSKKDLNPAIERMKKAWGECGYEMITTKGYSEKLDKIKELDYSAKDVEAFCIGLVEFQGENGFQFKAGLFLSALINNCKEDDFVIHTKHLTEPIYNIGYLNRNDHCGRGCW